jgi:hypothetical protein
MTDATSNRVLCRRGARELNIDETEFVVGAAPYNTLVCTDIVAGARTGTTTGPGDGDGCSDTDTDLA